MWVADELLRAEGFKTLEYTPTTTDDVDLLAAGKLDVIFVDSADTIRFLALRMHETGVIKSSPQRIIADGMDWRFVDELKKELKG